MVAADVLVDHAQVEPEVVGAIAAAEHAAGEQQAVVRRFGAAGRRIELRRLRRHARAVALPVQQRAVRLAEMAHEDPAQALGVFRRHGHAVAAAPVGGSGPCIAGLDGDGPALQVFLAALQLGRAGLGAAVRVHHENAAGVAGPVLRNRDPVEGAGAVFTGVAVGRFGHGRGAGGGLGAGGRGLCMHARRRTQQCEGCGSREAGESFFQWRTPSSSAAFAVSVETNARTPLLKMKLPGRPASACATPSTGVS